MGPRQGFLIFFTFFHGLYIYYLFLKKNLWDNQLFSLRFCPIKFSFNNISYLDRNVLFPMTNANAMSSQNHVGIMQVGPNKETLPLDSDFFQLQIPALACLKICERFCWLCYVNSEKSLYDLLCFKL